MNTWTNYSFEQITNLLVKVGSADTNPNITYVTKEEKELVEMGILTSYGEFKYQVEGTTTDGKTYEDICQWWENEFC